MKQGKLRYLTYRTLCIWGVMILLLTVLLGDLLYRKVQGEENGWFFIILGIGLLIFCIWYTVVQIWLPYRRIGKRIGLFLDGYTTSNLVGEKVYAGGGGRNPHFSGTGEPGQQNAVPYAVTGDAEPE